MGDRLRPMKLLLFAAAVAVAAADSIYPSDHWSHSKELTTDNAEAWIKEQVDAGKTAMVRWIASEG